MKSAIYMGPGIINLEEVNKPVINANEYLIEVLCSGLCGTDIKTYKQGHHMFVPPTVLGHEFCGKIVEAGENVDSTLIGKKIVCAPYVSCGHCEMCQKGLEELCFNKIGTSGSFTEFLIIDTEVAKKGMVVLEDNANVLEMSLAEPLACILNSIRKSNIQAGQNVLVMGAGPMGLIHVEVLKDFGCDTILVTEFNQNRTNIAKEMGAIVINPSVENVKDKIDEYTKHNGVDHIIVCVGLSSAVEEAFQYANNGTVINVFGGLKSGSMIQIDPNLIHYNNVTLVGSFGFTPTDFKLAARLLENGKVSLTKIITNTYKLSEIREAFENSSSPDVIKILVEMI